MKVWEILKKVGGGVIKQICPAAAAVIEIVNDVLPDDQQLPLNATGTQVEEAIGSLPPEQQAIVLTKQLDVEIEDIRAHSINLQTLAEADIAGASTRPQIALMMARTVVFTIVVMVSMLAYAIGKNHITMIASLTSSWQLVLALVGTPCALLRAYFAMRTKEKQGRMNLVAGETPAAGLISTAVKLFKKR